MSQTLAIDGSEPVTATKHELLRALRFDRVFPSVLLFSFCTIGLRDEAPILSYQIPNECTFEFESSQSDILRV
jgi:hypothetical protein